MLESLSTDLISAFVAFCIGFALRYLLSLLKNLPFRGLWKGFGREGDVLIVLSARPGPLTRSTKRVSFSEVEGYAALRSVLSYLGASVRAVSSEEAVSVYQRSDCVLLGGPIANEATAQMLGAYSPKLPFVLDESGQTITLAHDKYVPVETDGVITVDYGVLVRAANPFDRQRHVAMSIGCHGFATRGGVDYLTNRDMAARLGKIAKGNNFVAVLRFDLAKGKVIRSAIEQVVLLADLG